MPSGTQLNQVITRVEGLTPTSEPTVTFRCEDDAAGGTPPLEELAQGGAGAFRIFDIRTVTGPMDDGQATVANLRFHQDFALRVAYPWGGNPNSERMKRIANDDTEAIIQDLRNPNNWGAVGIDGLNIGLPDQKPTDTEIGGPSGPAFLRVIPFRLRFT